MRAQDTSQCYGQGWKTNKLSRSVHKEHWNIQEQLQCHTRCISSKIVGSSHRGLQRRHQSS